MRNFNSETTGCDRSVSSSFTSESGNYEFGDDLTSMSQVSVSYSLYKCVDFRNTDNSLFWYKADVGVYTLDGSTYDGKYIK